MKIVHVIEPLAGGLITFLKSLVENMPGDSHIIVHGEREQVISFTEAKKQFSFPNVRFIRWKSAQRSLLPIKDFNAFIELYIILKRLKKNNSLDIVHLHSSKGGFIGRVVCRLLKIQSLVVYTPNGAPFLVGNSVAANFLYRILEKIGSAFGGQVVCCSPSEQRAYQSAGIKTVTINNGIEYDKNADRPVTKKKDNIFRVVTSGRIVAQKNPVLFNKIAAYFEELKGFEFVWVGNGPDGHLLTAKNITITGWLDKTAVDDIVNDADVYLSTAHFEGLPFAVLEALALKKPVLLTDCVGNKDLVLKGLNGSVFKNKYEAINRILHFYNNAAMLKIMGEHSKLHARNSFDYTDTCSGYKKLYQQAAYFYKNSHVGLNTLAYGTR